MDTSALDPALRAHLFRQLRWGDLDPAAVRRLVEWAREEDLAGYGLQHPPMRPGDVSTALLPENAEGRAWLVARREMVVCGLHLVGLVLDAYGPGAAFRLLRRDGETVPPGTALAEVSGKAAVLLPAERVLLNFLQKLSGIATYTARCVEALGDAHTKLLDTRKTTPGWRGLEKYAVACGGGWTHRMGLFDRVMLKDNHLAAGKSTDGEALAKAVRAAYARTPGLPIEVEVDRRGQIAPVLEAGAHVILLDNFSREDLRAAVGEIGGRALTEASGGITPETLPQLRGLGLDFVSCGALTHQAPWVDIGLDWEEHP